ncbi:hypothetical protein JK361_25910 [Streptomyces sp. 5-8]|uniref:Tail terminator n=1 Tax=Streptomyces musisoli TaxID=2802280 RepID=A0ABS1P6R4_9ACTN|nr:minor capsid protein [Streptomyces musisoli]MBL1107983.1 hypothetical protein [Streptomyces musisoli]
MTDTHDTDLLTGIAVLLDTEGVGVYSPDDVLPQDSTAVVLGRMPDGPDRALGLTPYPVADDDTTNAITGIQVRMRAGTDPTDLVQLGNGVFSVLHNRQHYTAGGVHVALSWRQSQAWIGQDDRGRMELTANYYFRTTRSGPHLID